MGEEYDAKIRAFFAALFVPDDLIEIRMIGDDYNDVKTVWIQARDIGIQHALALDNVLKEYGLRGCHYGCCPRPAVWRRKKTHIQIVRCLWADYDNCEREQLNHHLSQKPKPTTVVHSGGGYHVSWRLNAPIQITDGIAGDTQRDDLKARMLGIIRNDRGDLVGDAACTVISGVLKLPYTHNYKEKYGATGRLVQIVEINDVKHPLSSFPPVISPPKKIKHDKGILPQSGTASSSWADYNARGAWEEILEPQGWDCVGANRWRHDGATHSYSATILEADDGTELLHVFTSNAPPLEPGETYNKFQVYALYNHDGDFSDAAKALYSKGFGNRDFTLRAMEAKIQEIMGGKNE